MNFGWWEGSGWEWDHGGGVWQKLGSLLEVNPKVLRLWDPQILGSRCRPSPVADDVSLTPRDDVLIDIDDKEPLIPIQVWNRGGTGSIPGSPVLWWIWGMDPT